MKELRPEERAVIAELRALQRDLHGCRVEGLDGVERAIKVIEANAVERAREAKKAAEMAGKWSP